LQRTSASDYTQLQSAIEVTEEMAKDISLIHWLFFNVFAEAIVHTVGGEDEIFLLEETPTMRRLYIWQKGDGKQKEQKKDGSLFPID
jgi:hypothetical protein